MNTRTLTFRSQLKGELDDFLKDEGVECSRTCSALVAFAASLASYKEEGISLSPEVFFCDSVEEIAQFLPSSDFHRLGNGPQEDTTIRSALKECAPLARGGWSIFVERGDPTTFQYGVIASADVPFSLTLEEAIIGDTSESEIFALLIRRVAENCVEIRGSNGHARCVFFSDLRYDSPNPAQTLATLARVLTSAVEGAGRDRTRRFLERCLFDSLNRSHGALIAVMSARRKKLPTKLRDAVQLDHPIDLVERVENFHKYGDSQSVARLESASALIEGMLASDGILIARTDGLIIAYRGFLQQSKTEAGTRIVGGSRRRTFGGLTQLVSKNDLVAAFFRSQDGDTEISEVTP
ncbi:hypothetical protein [Fuerstiella marisgermanici]|uniref:DAC domain-containing protein n=1 Tax=Fuerstiella marisgermanici TaxID=1891926 RepID=A0A1P8WP89_9PLAN|nr:hypothetical protein [Fuerstiella marisgermanici]APZ95871.1 hypothetical protein Fuma_05534 [Fuerstiella marisgermanici]